MLAAGQLQQKHPDQTSSPQHPSTSSIHLPPMEANWLMFKAPLSTQVVGLLLAPGRPRLPPPLRDMEASGQELTHTGLSVADPPQTPSVHEEVDSLHGAALHFFQNLLIDSPAPLRTWFLVVVGKQVLTQESNACT